MPVPRKQSLTTAKRRLLEIAQRVHFGRIMELQIHNGEPCFQTPPLIERDHKFGLKSGARREVSLDDFAMKKVWVELFDQFNELGEGLVRKLDVRDGLPYSMTIVSRFDHKKILPRFASIGAQTG